MEETNSVRRRQPGPAALDRTDQRILRALAEDASRSYAALGQLVNLSAPAVHERVRRLKRDGVIRRVVAQLDGPRIGCPLLAYIMIESTGWCLTGPVLALRELADVEEIHTMTGDAGILLKVRTRDTADLEALLERIYAIEGVRGTRTHVVLNTALERGPMPEPG